MCDKEGKHNPNGEHCSEKKALKFKFPKEGWWCFGCGIINRGTGPVGKQDYLFNYTCKNIIHIKQFKEMLNKAVQYAKKLPRHAKGWVKTSFEPDTLYLNDLIKMIPGVKDKKAELLVKNGIAQVKDLVGLIKNNIKKIAKSVKVLGVECCKNITESTIMESQRMLLKAYIGST